MPLGGFCSCRAVVSRYRKGELTMYRCQRSLAVRCLVIDVSRRPYDVVRSIVQVIGKVIIAELYETGRAEMTKSVRKAVYEFGCL